ncbi:hypothetical protein MLD38_019278 [Melastoma candidum]|uniref:Uncharacterized protein n=1 Tax=Melastoma candidum TaxID=119954 RepID=A0ACB9QXT3_9MYRT|nr:hypothetical protein MLD38_019278 [Melastoma candidum]
MKSLRLHEVVACTANYSSFPSLRLPPLPIPSIICTATRRDLPCARDLNPSTLSRCISVSSPMSTDQNKHEYSVWAVPPEDVSQRLRCLMAGLRAEFGGPEFDPHITVVGLVSLTEEDALSRFRAACEGLKEYEAVVEGVGTGSIYWQCVYLLIKPTEEVVAASDHCCRHFGYLRSSPYMPHLSLVYGDISDEEKKKAQEKANILDDNLNCLSFKISRLVLCKTPLGDLTTKSWEVVLDYTLNAV